MNGTDREEGTAGPRIWCLKHTDMETGNNIVFMGEGMGTGDTSQIQAQPRSADLEAVDFSLRQDKKNKKPRGYNPPLYKGATKWERKNF